MAINRDATGKFPEYPDEDDGGSALIFKEKSPEELEAEMKEKVSRVTCEIIALHFWNLYNIYSFWENGMHVVKWKIFSVDNF